MTRIHFLFMVSLIKIIFLIFHPKMWKIALHRMHRRRRRGVRRGSCPPPQKKNREKYFSGKNHVKFGNFVNFSGKYHVIVGHFVNFSCMYFRAKMSCPSPQSWLSSCAYDRMVTLKGYNVCIVEDRPTYKLFAPKGFSRSATLMVSFKLTPDQPLLSW